MASKGNAATEPEPKSPGSPTPRRFSLGFSNDGEGNPMYKACVYLSYANSPELAEEAEQFRRSIGGVR
jgi:hypothetical protein